MQKNSRSRYLLGIDIGGDNLSQNDSIEEEKNPKIEKCKFEEPFFWYKF